MEARPSGKTRLRRMTGALPSHRSPPHHNRTSTAHATQNLSDHEPFIFQFENERHIAKDMELSRARTFSPAFSHTPDSAHATDSGSQAQFDADDYQFAEASSGPEALSGNSATLNSIDLWPEPPVEMDNDDQMGAATTLLGLRAVPKATLISIAPPGLMESAIFAEDMIYYHHLRDVPPLGILSNLSLDSIFDAEYLDSTFFHAALALSALDISISGTSESHASLAGLHALEHFVVALSTVGKMKSSAEQAAGDPSGSASTGGNKQQRAICWMATVLLLAQFELQRGQMGPWYTHSRGAIAFLTQNLQVIRQSSVGRLLIRSFSRIAALLDIYDRVFSIHTRLSSSDVSTSLFESLTQSPFPSDRLLYIIPRVIQLEEEWRSNPESKMRWEDQAGTLLDELEYWKSSLEMCDVPCFDDESADNSQHTRDVNSSTISPLRLPKSPNPTQAATHYMHYLVSILRLKYPLHTVQSIPPCAEEIVLMVCRLAAGVPVTSCAAVNAYGHGMLPP
ncbi:Sterol uptake control protein 2 [Penicillium expansum]|nr:Sterol uptake control protein 2 [Penicillium expansum]